MYTGKKTSVFVGLESTFGVQSPTLLPLAVDEINLNPKVEYAENTSTFGRIESTIGSDIVKKYSQPALAGKLSDISVGLFLFGGLGQVSSSADTPEVGVSMHTFSVLNSNHHPSYTVVVKDDTGTKMATGCVLNTLEVDIQSTNYIQFRADFVGMFPQTITHSGEWSGENLFLSQETSVRLADTLAGLATASDIAFESAKLSINKSAQAQYRFGSVEPAAIVNTSFDVKGDFVLMHEDDTYYDIWEQGNKKALRLTLTNPAQTIGVASHPQITFDLAMVRLSDWGKGFSLKDITTQNMGFAAEYSLSDNKMLSVSLQNTHTSY